MALSVGERLGSYEIVAPLGAGGMGEVYRASDLRLGRDVAVKILPASVAADADRLRRFEQEARATGQLNHPNIVAVYDIGTISGTPFIVYELLEGQTLRDRLRAGALPMRKAIEYAGEIARGLAVAHAQGVVHRDLKPENLFVTRDGRIKILDFGLAKLKRDPTNQLASNTPTEKQTREGVILGTVGYMAPEQVRGQPADHRADIFSLGTILYEMICGKRAFRGDSDVETMNAILTQDPPPLGTADPSLPPALAQVIEHSLEKEPADRFQSVQDLAFDLELVSSVSRSGGAIADDRRSIALGSRARWVITALVLVIAAIVGGAITARIMRRPDATRNSPIMVRRLTEFLGLENFPALSPDGRSVAFIAGVGGRRQLWVRLVAGGPALQLTRDAANHVYPRWSRDSSSLIYFSPPLEGEQVGSLWEISALGGAPRRLAASLSDGDLSETDQLAFFRLRSGKIDLVAAKRDGSDITVVVPELERGYQYGSPRWSPDGKSIAYERSYHGSPLDGVFAVRTNDKKPRQLTFGPLDGFAWRPDGSGIVFSSGRGSIMVYQETFQLWSTRLDDKEPRQLTFGEVSYVHPDMDRSGTIVATRIRFGSDLWRFPVTGDGAANVRAATPVTRQTAEVRVPSVSPSGREIVYLSDIGGHSNLWVKNLDSGESRELTFETDPNVQIGLPLWSPDGRRIAFYWTRGNDFGYSTILPDGSGVKKVITKGWWVCWSPDGRWLYYQDRQQPDRRLMKIPADGGSPVVVRAESATMPALSPDGAILYFIVEMPRATGTDLEIRSASPETGTSRLLAQIAAHRVPESGRFHPVMSPDGRWLAFPLRDGATTNIWAVATSDGAMRRITDFGERTTFITRRVSWSPDGKSIYAAVSEGDADIVLFDGLQP